MLVTKTVRFDAAHLLSGDAGKCGNLHGHTYRVDISVQAPDDAEGDMVVDFRALKAAAEDVILTRFDHAFLYNETSPVEREIAAVVAKNGLRSVAFSARTTCENLARHFLREMKVKIPSVASVKVWETADNCAECRV